MDSSVYNINEPYIRNRKTLNIEFKTTNDYKDISTASATFPHFKEINNSKYHELENAYCFVMRSNNDDDIHKSIKYGVWTSGKDNNEQLSKAYKLASASNTNVFLFYSVVKSGQFVGVAKLVSDLQDESFPYWWQLKKWKGHFKVQWVQVKDIPNKHLEQFLNKEGVSVTHSKDGSVVEWNKHGKNLLKFYEDFKSYYNIFHDFDKMEEREKELRNYRQ